MGLQDGDNSIPEPKKKIGLKKSNPEREQVSPAQFKRNFEQKADQEFAKIEDYKQEMWDLSVQFKSFIESKILSENKGPIVSNLEKEILDKLISLATKMNEDPLQPEGLGNTAICMLLLKCMLLQRDTINQLHYKVHQLEKNGISKDSKPV